MSDPIQPPAARRPEEALELVAQALSDGDLEAALAQYEPQARLVAWRPQPGGGEIRAALACFMALRLPLAVQVMTVLSAPGLALVVCARQTSGRCPDGEEVRYAGTGCAVVRAQPDGSWRIAADAWQLACAGESRPGHPAPDARAQSPPVRLHRPSL